jgi:hypothetical protein
MSEREARWVLSGDWHPTQGSARPPSGRGLRKDQHTEKRSEHPHASRIVPRAVGLARRPPGHPPPSSTARSRPRPWCCPAVASKGLRRPLLPRGLPRLPPGVQHTRRLGASATLLRQAEGTQMMEKGMKRPDRAGGYIGKAMCLTNRTCCSDSSGIEQVFFRAMPRSLCPVGRGGCLGWEVPRHRAPGGEGTTAVRRRQRVAWQATSMDPGQATRPQISDWE